MTFYLNKKAKNRGQSRFPTNWKKSYHKYTFQSKCIFYAKGYQWLSIYDERNNKDKWTSKFLWKTSRRRYVLCPVTETCILLRRISLQKKWTDLEYKFTLNSLIISQILWECVGCFIDNSSHLIKNSTFRTQFIRERAEIYADDRKDNGELLDFIDGNKIQMTRSSGSNYFQRSCYSGHKRFHCLIYQTITTPDGIIYNFYGSHEGIRNDMEL